LRAYTPVHRADEGDALAELRDATARGRGNAPGRQRMSFAQPERMGERHPGERVGDRMGGNMHRRMSHRRRSQDLAIQSLNDPSLASAPHSEIRTKALEKIDSLKSELSNGTIGPATVRVRHGAPGTPHTRRKRGARSCSGPTDEITGSVPSRRVSQFDHEFMQAWSLARDIDAGAGQFITEPKPA